MSHQCTIVVYLILRQKKDRRHFHFWRFPNLPSKFLSADRTPIWQISLDYWFSIFKFKIRGTLYGKFSWYSCGGGCNRKYDGLDFVTERDRINADNADIVLRFSKDEEQKKYIARGTEEQKAKYLPEAAGKLAGFALTEPGAGTDASGQKTRAVKDGSDYILNGAKCFISNLGPEEGNNFICVAVTEPGIGAKGTTSFLVDHSMSGLSCGKVEDKMGIRGASVAELVLEDVRVPETAIIGGIGNGVKTALEGLDGGRIGIASQACGVAYGALDEAIKYSGERIQFGRPINANQGIQWYLAEMKAQADMAWLLTLRAASLRQAGKPCTVEAALAKWKAAEAAGICVDYAQQIHGGYGYMKDYPIERMHRDARILRIYEGTSEAQKMVISRALLKKHDTTIVDGGMTA